MNLLDFLLLIPIVWLCIRGFGKGLVLELATLAGLALGILAAYFFADELEAMIIDYFSFSSNATRIIAYIIIFLLVLLVLFIVGKLVEKSVDMVALGWLNKLLGAIIGIAKGILLVCIVLFLIEQFDPSQKIIKPDVKQKSLFYGPAMDLVHFVV